MSRLRTALKQRKDLAPTPRWLGDTETNLWFLSVYAMATSPNKALSGQDRSESGAVLVCVFSLPGWERGHHIRGDRAFIGFLERPHPELLLRGLHERRIAE